MTIETSEAITGAAEADAKARALAIECGANWKCSRVKSWVGLTDCIQRYVEAKDKDDYSPCLECASVAQSLRKMGCTPAANIKTPVALDQPQAQKKIIITAKEQGPMPAKIIKAPKPKSPAATSKPAKKGTPDPIQQEVEAIVTEAAPEVKESAATLTSPFDGWQLYDPKTRKKAGLKSFVTISSAGVISFSSLATDELELKSYQSVDVFRSPDGKKIGLRLHKDKAGALSLTIGKKRNKNGATISGVGVINDFRMEKFKGMRFAVERFGADLVLTPAELGRAA